MARPRRLLSKLLFAGALAAGGYLAWASTAGTPTAIDLLPPGPDVVIELHDAERLARRVEGTRFAAAFAASQTRAWLERTDAVAALDALRTDIGRVTGFTPGRSAVFDLGGSELAAGWYPAASGAAGTPWVAAGRLSARAWAAAAALRLARGLGLGASLVGTERVAGRTIYSLPGGGQSLHLFLVGRDLLAASDRALAREAARVAADHGAALSRTPAVLAVREALPATGELFAWVREPGRLHSAGLAAHPPAGPLGVLVRVGKAVEIDIAAGGVVTRASGSGAAGGAGPGALPATGLLASEPLVFLSSNDPVPPLLLSLIANRAAAVHRAGGPPGELQPGRGYAIAVTDTAAGSGLFPAPRGLVMLGMADAVAAGRALALLFPANARSTALGSTVARATRESFPLAGEFDLWGAAAGAHLLFATDTALIAAAAGAPPAGQGERAVPDPTWRVDALASISMTKALPLVRRWAAPLSGLIGARWPRAPQLADDLELLGAIRTVRLVAGADGSFERAAITLQVGDLP